MADIDTMPLAAQRNCRKLPERSFAFIETHEPGNRIVAIDRGETGYRTTTLDYPEATPEQARAIVDRYNRRLSVTVEQAEAMLAGSMFGFEGKGADPDYYIGRKLLLEDAA